MEFNLALGGAAGAGGTVGHGVGGVHSDGTFVFDAATVIRRNHASTFNDDLFP